MYCTKIESKIKQINKNIYFSNSQSGRIILSIFPETIDLDKFFSNLTNVEVEKINGEFYFTDGDKCYNLLCYQ